MPNRPKPAVFRGIPGYSGVFRGFRRFFTAAAGNETLATRPQDDSGFAFLGWGCDGIDTPEIRGECQEEKDLAIRARDFVRATVGAQVQLTNVRLGKYAGRVIAVVWVNERKLSDLLIAENLGRPYRGGRRRGWCP